MPPQMAGHSDVNYSDKRNSDVRQDARYRNPEYSLIQLTRHSHIHKSFFANIICLPTIVFEPFCRNNSATFCQNCGNFSAAF